MKFGDVGGGDGKKVALFVSMKDGDKVTGLFAGEPSIFKIHWVGNKSLVCVGKELCEPCQSGDKAKFRFKLNMIVKEDGVAMAKIFEGAYGMFLDLKNLHESDYNLEDTVVTVYRKGQKTDTRYTVLPVPPKGQPTPAELELMKKVPLNSLVDKDRGIADSFDDAPSGDIPF